jgi:hypothetical protein
LKILKAWCHFREDVERLMHFTRSILYLLYCNVRGYSPPHRGASNFRSPVSSLTIPGIVQRYGIVSLQDDDILHGGPPFMLAGPFSSLALSLLALRTSWSHSRSCLLHYPCLILRIKLTFLESLNKLKMKLTTMKLAMNSLSLVLLAMPGVTADGEVRAYHRSFVSCFCMNSLPPPFHL